MGGSFLPISQKRLTNIAVVRLKRGGKHFEVAAFPNKVLQWRNRVERDIDEVLQTRQIFVNVHKGEFAKKVDLVLVFGTNEEDSISLQILEAGELQVSDKERQHHFDTLFHEIATVVAEKCVDSTGRPLTISLIERAMHDAHYAVVPTRTAKQQSLDVMRLLEQQSGVGIVRAQMRVCVRAERGDAAEVRALLAGLEGLKLERELTADAVFEAVCLIPPGAFRQLSHPPKSAARMAVEVLDARVTSTASSAAEPTANSASALPSERNTPAAIEPRELFSAASARAPGSGSAYGSASEAPKQFVCKSCPGAEFPTAQEHREHFKSEWHKFNLKLKTKGQPAVSQEELKEQMHDMAAGAGEDDFFK